MPKALLKDKEQQVGQALSDYFRAAIARDMSQRQIANELGVSRQTVSNWMRQCGYVYTSSRGYREAA